MLRILARGVSTIALLVLVACVSPAFDAAAPMPDPTALAAAATALPPQLRSLYDRDGLAFVFVPGGEFTMGSVEGSGDEDEQPAHPVSVDDFWIGLTEVTNGQYAAFVDADGYGDPSLWSEAGWAWRTQAGLTEPVCWRVTGAHPADRPVSCVAWYEADAYAAWLSRASGLPLRLPTEAEWEKAARGVDGRLYPWGNDAPDPARANLFGVEDGAPYAAPPGAYPVGASPYGALDMAGNVWEWTSSVYADYPYDAHDGREDHAADRDRVVRGGSWLSSAVEARAAARYKDDPDDWDGIQGFRLALTMR